MLKRYIRNLETEINPFHTLNTILQFHSDVLKNCIIDYIHCIVSKTTDSMSWMTKFYCILSLFQGHGKNIDLLVWQLLSFLNLKTIIEGKHYFIPTAHGYRCPKNMFGCLNGCCWEANTMGPECWFLEISCYILWKKIKPISYVCVLKDIVTWM